MEKYERESGVKFDIKRNATKMFFQQPEENALTNCDTEQVTGNLVTTVSHKSKSYLEAEKGNLADNNNNQTFTTRPTLEQGVAGNEGVPTAESATALEAVPTAEPPITNERVPTAESPLETETRSEERLSLQIQFGD